MPDTQELSPVRRIVRILLLIALAGVASWVVFNFLQNVRPDPSDTQAAEETTTLADTAELVSLNVEEPNTGQVLKSEVGEGRGLMSMLFGQQTGNTSISSEGTYGTSIEIEGLREHYVDTSKAKSATVLVYMCGADLETYSAAASKDLQEMVNAELGDKVKIVIQTGGAKQWHFSKSASSQTRQRWLIDNSGMYLLGDAGNNTMLDQQAVTNFATWGIENYPADRYLFVFWDHGGGTIGGYGSDEMYPRQEPLSLLEIRKALEDTNQKFDLVGFDACLMGTIETAYALEPVADYMLASEEYELGDGWYWTGFLSALGANPAIDTVELGKVAIDQFGEYYFKQRQGSITLSLVDLREVPHVYEQMGTFLKAAEESITKDNTRFAEMSQARTRARSFADGGIDQVDVIDLIERTNFDGRDELLAAVNSCVKYRSATTITGANGLAMYFPYSEVRQYQGTRSILNEIGYVSPTEFYDYFLSIMAGSSGSSWSGLLNPSGANTAQGTEGSAASAQSSSGNYADQSYSLEDWFNALLGGDNFNYQTVPDHLNISMQDGSYVVPMNQSMWNVFSSFSTTVMVDFEDGYLMLGRDDVYDQTESGDISVFFGNEWVTINNQEVSFFANEPYEETNGEYSHSGVIPALLNGNTYIEIVVYWPPQSQQGEVYTGYIQGYRMNENNYFTYGRGLQQFNKGDVITPVFDYYDKQGNYVKTLPGNSITINSAKDLEVTYGLSDHGTVHFWGTMTTIYGDTIDTDVITQ
ncbi:MAG: hypothetical protein IJ113_02625 [Eggerthellaceae bacterium]|nr:hypothetical protein [Eggerthellaceae bacterium]